MTRNPVLNAFAALLYILVIASVMYFFSRSVSAQLPFMVPIAVLSLFTLSAAVMGYIFLSQPIQIYLDGEKSLAVNLFLKTVAVFAAITALILLAIFLSALLV